MQSDTSHHNTPLPPQKNINKISTNYNHINLNYYHLPIRQLIGVVGNGLRDASGISNGRARAASVPGDERDDDLPPHRLCVVRALALQVQALDWKRQGGHWEAALEADDGHAGRSGPGHGEAGRGDVHHHSVCGYHQQPNPHRLKRVSTSKRKRQHSRGLSVTDVHHHSVCRYRQHNPYFLRGERLTAETSIPSMSAPYNNSLEMFTSKLGCHQLLVSEMCTTVWSGNHPATNPTLRDRQWLQSRTFNSLDC